MNFSANGTAADQLSIGNIGNGAGQININVANQGDVAKVADVIDRATGSRLHARLRTAGMRGT